MTWTDADYDERMGDMDAQAEPDRRPNEACDCLAAEKAPNPSAPQPRYRIADPWLTALVGVAMLLAVFEAFMARQAQNRATAALALVSQESALIERARADIAAVIAGAGDTDAALRQASATLTRANGDLAVCVGRLLRAEGRSAPPAEPR